jgi:RimJ/RimL family protein N-acetyltransferase
MNKLFFLNFLYLNIILFTTTKNKSNQSKIEKTDITIKPMQLSHIENYLELNDDKRVIKNHSGSFNPHDKTQYRKYLQNKITYFDEVFGYYVILYQNQFVGYIYFFPDQSLPKSIYIAYSIKPKFWNLGIGTLAINLIINLLKEKIKQRNYTTLLACVHCDNIPSQRILEKNQFKNSFKTQLMNNTLCYILERKI